MTMDYAVIVSAIVLGLSVLATAAKFLDWFIHSDPPTMIRVSRWMLLLLVLACVPVLVWMIGGGRWPEAMLLGAGMLVVATFLKWRAILQPLRAMLDRLRPRARPFDMPPFKMEVAPDAATVQRAAAILEAYVQSALPAPPQDGMSRAEALDVLGLAPGADEAAIRAAHRRLASLVHPDHSGSTYLMNKVDQARDTLLQSAREWPRLTNG